MNARKTKSSANLPFGLLFTRVFEHFHVPLPTSTSECIPLPSHHVLDEISLRRAGFVLRSDLTFDTVLLERVTATDPSHTQSVPASAPASLLPPSPAPEIPSAAFFAPPSSIPPTPPSSTPFIPPVQTDPSSSSDLRSGTRLSGNLAVSSDEEERVRWWILTLVLDGLRHLFKTFSWIYCGVLVGSANLLVMLLSPVTKKKEFGGRWKTSTKETKADEKRLSGQNHHRIGSLLPLERKSPKFAQLYMYDSKNVVANRMAAFSTIDGSSNLDSKIVEKLVRVFDTNNEIVKMFRPARKWFKQADYEHVHLRLLECRASDGRLNNMPNVDEVAGLIPGSNPLNPRDIIVDDRTVGLN
ncbi:hypothetical protein RJ639_008181 [Escallonia herrerae]|uniref:Uncharacterized protein n=1 Tax=Escallonia herrerae TaxID=1293975 RepID=A0AA89AX23_9ASTE|nr:hypothetical protein RJ639_008181 [Escallonia herrerae]